MVGLMCFTDPTDVLDEYGRDIGHASLPLPSLILHPTWRLIAYAASAVIKTISYLTGAFIDYHTDFGYAAVMFGKYLKLVPGGALLHALDDDIDCFLICHVVSLIGIGCRFDLHGRQTMPVLLSSRVCRINLFRFRNPMSGMALIIDLIRVIYKKPFIDKMLDALIHH